MPPQAPLSPGRPGFGEALGQFRYAVGADAVEWRVELGGRGLLDEAVLDELPNVLDVRGQAGP
ncbi:hypothetical protein GCM10010340_19060 [Streptomyces griseoloalbus]|nr:hypothetical protein GCM10010340_19060 [Streptomyces albaduncus]